MSAKSGNASAAVLTQQNRDLSPSIERARQKCQEKGLKKYKWKCNSFPDLQPELEDHLLAATSRPGREGWLMPENVVGSKAWFNAVGPSGHHGRKWLQQYNEFNGHMDKSWNLHPTRPCRDAWVLGSDVGCVHGNPSMLDPPLLGYQPKGYAPWVTVGERWTPAKKGVPRVVPAREFNEKSNAAMVAISQGKDPKTATKNLSRRSASETSGRKSTLQSRISRLSGSGSRGEGSPKSQRSQGSSVASSPNLPVLGPFPPTPAYVRHYMSHRGLDLSED
jgi:hypothetical protein|mmetsp:Transcript_2409/g.3599  ORF Transcript_2409/g.3599 Transcript_2409/m.3599 type:complete len:277 (-) Transcript_2409:1-831(-)